MVFILSALWCIRVRGLWKLPDGRNLGLVLMDRTMLSKFLIQFFVDGVKPNYGITFKKIYASTVVFSASDPVAGHYWSTPLLTGKSGSVSCEVTTPFSWALVCTRFHFRPPKSVSPVAWKFCNQIPLASKVKFPGVFQSLCWIPRLGNLLWLLELS